MNLQRLFLISILVNLVCLAGLFWMLTERQQSPTQFVTPVSVSASAGVGQAPAQETPVERIVREVEAFHWSQIEADDYRLMSRTCAGLAARKRLSATLSNRSRQTLRPAKSGHPVKGPRPQRILEDGQPQFHWQAKCIGQLANGPA